MNIIIKSVVISEKSTTKIDKNIFTFIVDSSTNKVEIKNYLKKEFDIDVISVRISNLKSKLKRKGRQLYRTSPKKKAYVRIDSGSNVDKIKKLF